MQKTAWDLTDLRVFCQVAKRASFIGAAAELGVSPAYVTKRIASLEGALHAKLFHRTTRRVMISEAGEAVYAWATKILDAANELDNGIRGTAAQPAGPLRISTSLRLGRLHLSPILLLLTERYPGLQVWLELMDRRVDLLGEGFDIDIRMGEVSEPHLVAHPVAPNARVLCAAPKYLASHGPPRTLADLSNHDCLLYRERHQVFGTWRMQGPNGAESVKVTGPVGSNHSDIVRQWCLEGRGIMLLAWWDVAKEIRSGELVRVLPHHQQPADLWAVTAARADRSAKLRVCLAFITEQLNHGPYALATDFHPP